MKRYSKKWMQSFLQNPLPNEDKEIIDQMSKKAFEIESVEKSVDGDSLFEIKVLANRVGDAMSLEGMAKEMSAVFSNPLHDWRPKIDLSKYEIKNLFHTFEKRELESLVSFSGFKAKIDGIKETPEWIKDIIEKSGGRSINSLVDITNLVLFSVGQPTHVFDADKIDNGIVTRFAQDGEELVLLDGKKITLTKDDFVIADNSKVLSLAGVKGGKAAEVETDSKNVFFEVANFNSTMIRKTTQRQNLRTDASKIYENGISTNKTQEAFKLLLATFLDVYPDAKIEFIVNNVFVEKNPKPVLVDFQNVRNYAGTNLSNEEIQKLLELQGFGCTEKDGDTFEVTPTDERLDIEIEEDVIEEVLRLYGFDNLESKPLNLNNKIKHDTTFVVESIIRKYLIDNLYTEVINYTFKDKGEVKVVKGLSSDKEFLRTDLISELDNTFSKNYNFMPLLEMDILKFFEIGAVFTKTYEERKCLIVCDDNKKKTKYLADLEKIISDLEELLEVKIHVSSKNEKPAAIEFSISKIVEEVDKQDLNLSVPDFGIDVTKISYKPISVYPFIVRDVSMWVPKDFSFDGYKNELTNLSLENATKIYMFDSFTPSDEANPNFGKTSVAFRIIFQSYTDTLTDEFVEKQMKRVLELNKAKEFEMR